MPNFRLDLSYDGSRYNGWQRQKTTQNTLQEKLETTLSELLGESVSVSASGRTDAGVHALMQVVSFRAHTELPPDDILAGLRRYLPEDIGAISLTVAPPRFHARLSCREKTYLYRIHTGSVPCVFDRKYVMRHPGELDTGAMKAAAAKLTGTHDYAAFSTGKTKKSTVRTVSSIELEQLPDELRLYFTGDGFLYNMVRIMTGTLIEVGEGLRSPDTIDGIFDLGERKNAGATAPAKGLFLYSVRY